MYQSSNWADDSVILKAVNMDSRGKMERYAKQGVERLREMTPKRTGETANGWNYTLEEKSPATWELVFNNDSHPETPLNVAFLIDRGHYTRTGGYVPPQPFISQALLPVTTGLWFDILKELI